MTIRLPNDRVLIRQIEVSASTGYGQTKLIEIPETCRKEIKFFGEVLAIGSKANGDLSIGDYVIVGTYAQYIFETGSDADGTLAIVPEKDIACVLSEPPDYIDIVPDGARQLAEVA